MRMNITAIIKVSTEHIEGALTRSANPRMLPPWRKLRGEHKGPLAAARERPKGALGKQKEMK
jgi:hypothetical protein